MSKELDRAIEAVRRCREELDAINASDIYIGSTLGPVRYSLKQDIEYLIGAKRLHSLKDNSK